MNRLGVTWAHARCSRGGWAFDRNVSCMLGWSGKPTWELRDARETQDIVAMLWGELLGGVERGAYSTDSAWAAELARRIEAMSALAAIATVHGLALAGGLNNTGASAPF